MPPNPPRPPPVPPPIIPPPPVPPPNIAAAVLFRLKLPLVASSNVSPSPCSFNLPPICFPRGEAKIFPNGLSESD